MNTDLGARVTANLLECRRIREEKRARASMPKVNIGQLHGEALRYALAMVHKDGSLYASKPDHADAKAKYVWRMVVFMVSPKSEHHCMPICADFELYASIDKPREEREAIRKGLDVIADRIIDAVPVNEWHGVKRWGMALGML